MQSSLPCLPLIAERCYNSIKDTLKEEGIKHPQFTFDMFEQCWGSTALGFGGIGGQAMTNAYTTVVRENQTGICCVFFGEQLAYTVHRPNGLFISDSLDRNMADVYGYPKYITKLSI